MICSYHEFPEDVKKTTPKMFELLLAKVLNFSLPFNTSTLCKIVLENRKIDNELNHSERMLVNHQNKKATEEMKQPEIKERFFVNVNIRINASLDEEN